MSDTKTTQCVHDANEFGTLDNVTGKCWVCGQAGARTQHTPGPWKYGNSVRASNFGAYSCSVQARDSRGPATIAKANGGNFDDKEHAEANARLLAAAPELLGAIKKFIAFGKNEGDTSWHSCDAQSFFYEMMCAAGKAEGRE